MEHFVKDHSKTPALALLTVERPQVCFRSHIGRRPNVEDPADFRLVDDFTEAEIDDNGVHASINDDVRWFQVSMQDVLFDKVGNSFDNLLESHYNVLLAHVM